MKALLVMVLLTAACGRSDVQEFDDTAIQNKLADHEARILALESLTGPVNARVAQLEQAQEGASAALSLAIDTLRAELTEAMITSSSTSTAALTVAVDDLRTRVEALELARDTQEMLGQALEARIAALEASDPVSQSDLQQAVESLKAALEAILTESNKPDKIKEKVAAAHVQALELQIRLSVLEALFPRG